MAKTTAKTEAPTESRGCACGCGESVERTFKQGHDQRLISRLAEDVVYQSVWDGSCLGILKTRLSRQADIQVRINTVRDYVAAKLSEPLAAKFESAVLRAWEQQKNKDAREQTRAARKAENAAKPKKTRKTVAAARTDAATPSEEAGAAAPKREVGKVVTATASNDDVDAEEAAADASTGLASGDSVRIKAGKRTRTAIVHGMNRAGKVTAVRFMNAGKEVIKTEGQFEIVG